MFCHETCMGEQEHSGRVLDLRPRGRRFEPHGCHCVVSFSKNINPRLVLVQPRKTRPFITERLLMGCNDSNQNQMKLVLSNQAIHTHVRCSCCGDPSEFSHY